MILLNSLSNTSLLRTSGEAIPLRAMEEVLTIFLYLALAHVTRSSTTQEHNIQQRNKPATWLYFAELVR